MITDDQRREDEAAFAAAFDEDMAAAPAPDESDSFGIDPTDEAAKAEPETEAMTIAVVDGEQVKEQAEREVADATTDSADEDMEQPVDPKEIQRQKSWEGRLRAREEELARREAELKAKLEAKPAATKTDEVVAGEDAMEQAAEQLEADGDSQAAEAVEEVAEKVQNGELTAQQAMAILAEDFGPEFVKMIQAIAVSQAETAAQKVAQGAIGQVQKSVQGVISSIVDDKARSHFETIADAHPDFDELAEDPAFLEFAKTYPDGQRITEGGTAREVVKMLNKYKEAMRPVQTEPDPALDAAEGVRSSGLRLPEAPSKADGYEDAWKEF